MDVNFWSVPIVSQSAIDLPGKYGQGVRRTTTLYNVGDRRHHKAAVHWLSPGILFKSILIYLFFFVTVYIFTLAVPGIVLAITKDKSLGWLFGAWAGVVAIVAVVLTRSDLIKRVMIRHALKERGLPANAKIAIVPDGRWDRWVAKLR